MATTGILSNLTKMVLGLKGEKPSNFGVNPIPPNSIHNTYSTTGEPDVKWRTISGTGMKPAPSRLDNLSKSKYKSGKDAYVNNQPKG
jgi:hypothetical protein